MAYQINVQYCVGCQACYRACPFGAVEIVDPHYHTEVAGAPVTDSHSCYIDPAKCKECGFCVIECPVDVISLVDESGAPKERSHYNRVWIEESECIGCTKCARNCPVDAITGEKKKPFHIDESKCRRCGVCLEGCPKNAVHAE